MSELNSEILCVVEDVFGNPRKHNRSRYQISYDCPVCDDEKHKNNLEINYDKLVMKCWKCGESDGGLKGSLRKLIKLYGSSRNLKLYDSITEDHNPETGRYQFDENYKSKLTLPAEYIRLTNAKNTNEYRKAYNYVRNRGLTDEIIARYDFGYCPTGKFGGRIIIPSYDKDGDLNYFVARSYVGHRLPYMLPDAEKQQIIVNHHAINWDATIYIVEGMFDMTGLGLQNTIPLLGKVLHDKLFYELVRKAKGYVVILLDPDAIKDAYKIYKKLHDTKELHDKVRVIDLPNNMDIAEIRKEYGEAGVYDSLTKVRKLVLADFIKYVL